MSKLSEFGSVDVANALAWVGAIKWDSMKTMRDIDQEYSPQYVGLTSCYV